MKTISIITPEIAKEKRQAAKNPPLPSATDIAETCAVNMERSKQFDENIKTLARRGVIETVIKELEATGFVGAWKQAEELASATDEEIAAFNAAWEAIKPYIDASPQEQQRRNERDAEKYMKLQEEQKAENTPEAVQKLKPCPFCGNGGEIRKNNSPEKALYEPKCSDIACGGGITRPYGTQEAAIEAWNKRK